MKRNIRLIYTHSIFIQMLFLLPVVIPYYHSIGLTFQDFLLGEAAFAAVVLLADVPAGWVSDVWTRRGTMVLAGFFVLIGITTLMLATGFWMAVLAQCVIGIAVALNSGTNTAILYDTLFEQNAQDDYVRTDGHRHGLGIYGTGISCLAGGFLFHFHPKLPLLADLIVIVVAMLAIAQVKEPDRHKMAMRHNPFHDVKETIRFAITGHPEILGILMLSAVILCTTKLMLWSQQPYYALVGIPIYWYGAVMAGMYVLGGIAGQNAHRLQNFGTNRQALAFTAIMLTLACFCLILFESRFMALAGFLVGTLAYAMGMPRINNAINAGVGGERRATILSCASLMVNLLFIPTSAIVGWLNEHGGILQSLLWIGGQVFILSQLGLYLWAKKEIKHRHPS